MQFPAHAFDDDWSWPIFAAVITVLLGASMGTGALQQVEELLLLPAEERGQTTPVEVGWPFVVLGTVEAHTLDFAWAERKLPIGCYVLANLLIVGVVAYAATRQLARLAQCTRSTLNIDLLLTGISTFACVLASVVDWYWYQRGVGALSMAVFRFVDALLLLFIALTWHYFVSRLGAWFARVLKRGETQA